MQGLQMPIDLIGGGYQPELKLDLGNALRDVTPAAYQPHLATGFWYGRDTRQMHGQVAYRLRVQGDMQSKVRSARGDFPQCSSRRMRTTVSA